MTRGVLTHPPRPSALARAAVRRSQYECHLVAGESNLVFVRGTFAWYWNDAPRLVGTPGAAVCWRHDIKLTCGHTAQHFARTGKTELVDGTFHLLNPAKVLDE